MHLSNKMAAAASARPCFLCKTNKDVLKTKKDIIISNSKKNRKTSCIEYRGTLVRGYGTISVNNKMQKCHRIIWHLYNQGQGSTCTFDISHLCHNTACVNIDHLVAEPHSTNCQRRQCNIKPRKCSGHGDYPRCVFE